MVILERLNRPARQGLWVAVGAAVTWGVAIGLLAGRQRAVLYPTGNVDVATEIARAPALGMVPFEPGTTGPVAEGSASTPAAHPAMAVRAWIGQPALIDGPARGTVVVFHGNSDKALNRAVYATTLGPLGYRVVLAEYPGYATFPGRPSEQALADANVALVDAVHAQFPGAVYLVGESLGAAAAARVAHDRAGVVSGVILITPWDSLVAVAEEHYPWAPVGVLLRERYDSVRAMHGFTGPVVVVAANDDRTIPPVHAHALFDTLPSAYKRFEKVPGGHTTWVLPDGFWATTLDWMATTGT